MRLLGGYLEAEALGAVDLMVLKMTKNGEVVVGRVAGHCASEAALLPMGRITRVKIYSTRRCASPLFI